MDSINTNETPNSENNAENQNLKKKKKKKMKEGELNLLGYPIDGISIAGHETCVILPTLNLAFDIGKCPQRAISQQFLFISHGHMDHIGGLPMYVATRGLYRMAPPTIVVPKVIKESVEKIFEAHREMDHSELEHTLIALDVGEEYYLRKDLKVRAFRTYHTIPSQGYIVYSVREKLKQEYLGLPGAEIKKLKLSGVKITNTTTSPEIAFTGDTMSDFITDPDNIDVLRSKILILESTYVENLTTVADAREYGHTHLSEIISYADRFENKAILLIHFSARYQLDVIEDAISALAPPLAGRVFALTKGF
ncbi:Nuclear ribonuclease Z [Forsythia ovata]|uniref:Nuclear ribonuclease Z n=1 Tax=Forsythia ovata TaxID=205694 RepID=A0ABD1R1Y4_9LAMI